MKYIDQAYWRTMCQAAIVGPPGRCPNPSKRLAHHPLQASWLLTGVCGVHARVWERRGWQLRPMYR